MQPPRAEYTDSMFLKNTGKTTDDSTAKEPRRLPLKML
jgi:hypothetical protein